MTYRIEITQAWLEEAMPDLEFTDAQIDENLPRSLRASNPLRERKTQHERSENPLRPMIWLFRRIGGHLYFAAYKKEIIPGCEVADSIAPNWCFDIICSQGMTNVPCLACDRGRSILRT